MIGLIIWASLARAQTLRGVDDFGRTCGVRLAPRISALVEGEWYDGAPDPAGPANLVAATLRARSDGAPADFELHREPGRTAWFRLILTSATGYAHVCRLDRAR